jgi:hypothetical protein
LQSNSAPGAVIEDATSLKLHNLIPKLQAIKLNARLRAFAWQRRHGVREKVRVME